MDLTASAPLFAFARGGTLEVVVSGLSLLKREGEPVREEAASVPIVARSLLKPWQFLAAEPPADAAYWTLGFASHAGQLRHLEALRQLSDRTGVREEALLCGPMLPLDPEVAMRMRIAGERPTRLHHPCAGKHLTWVDACRRLGFPVEGYGGTDHPLHTRLSEILTAGSGIAPGWVRDGCGLPTAVLPAGAYLQLWERLALDQGPTAATLRQLWLENPQLVGGAERLDTELIIAGEGALLAKQGADGLLAVQSLPGDGPVATCLIKLAAGENAAYAGLALWARLQHTPELPRPFQRLRDHLSRRLGGWIVKGQDLVLPPDLPAAR